MNCADFQLKLPAMLAEKLSPSTLLQTEQHLASCPDCLVKWSDTIAVQAAQSSRPNIAANVLNALGLDTCIAAQDALCDHRCDTLQLEPTVAMHLESCPDCAALSQIVLRLNNELPTLCEKSVPLNFTLRVLNRTSYVKQAPAKNTATGKQSWRAFARQVSQRPRFAMEAAYVLSLSLVITLGTPLFGQDGLNDVNQIISGARILGEQQSQLILEQNNLLVRSSREQWDKLYDTTYTQITTNTQRTQEWLNEQATQLLQTVESAQETLFGPNSPQQNI